MWGRVATYSPDHTQSEGINVLQIYLTAHVSQPAGGGCKCLRGWAEPGSANALVNQQVAGTLPRPLLDTACRTALNGRSSGRGQRRVDPRHVELKKTTVLICVDKIRSHRFKFWVKPFVCWLAQANHHARVS